MTKANTVLFLGHERDETDSHYLPHTP